MIFDLNVSPRSTRDKDRQLITKRLLELGFSAVAWNTSVPGKLGCNPSQHRPFPHLDLESPSVAAVIGTKNPASQLLRKLAIGFPNCNQSLQQFSRISVNVADAQVGNII